MSNIDAKMISADGTMTVIIDAKPHAVSADHPKYDTLQQAVIDNDADAFLEWINFEEKVHEYVAAQSNDGTGVVVKDGAIYYGGQVLHNAMADRTLRFMERGLPYEYMLKFMESLMENPSYRSVEQLYPFLEKEKIPITDDGHFLGYKVVTKYTGADFTDQHGRLVKNGDLVDKHSRSIRNNVGDVISLPRNRVDDNPDSDCSYGLHVGSLDYAGPGGYFHSSGSNDVCLIVKVNPKNVVSIPTYDARKLRCCEYEVVRPYTDLDDDLQSEFDEVEESDGGSLIVNRDLVDCEINFDYTHDGETKKRHVYVEAIDGTHIQGELLDKDPSWDGGWGDYRTFRIDRMSNIRWAD